MHHVGEKTTQYIQIWPKFYFKQLIKAACCLLKWHLFYFKLLKIFCSIIWSPRDPNSMAYETKITLSRVSKAGSNKEIAICVRDVSFRVEIGRESEDAHFLRIIWYIFLALPFKSHDGTWLQGNSPLRSTNTWISYKILFFVLLKTNWQ